ncbi:MAG: hypothetical protein ACKVPJ_01525, partial [Chitinophagales bacterium]
MKQFLHKTLWACIVLLLTTTTFAATESEPNDTKATADDAPLTATNTGSADNGGDQDWWKVTITGNGTLTITTTPTISSEFLWCYLYDNDGTTLLSSGYSTTTFNESRVDLAAGTYYIKFICFYSTDSTGYDFTATYTAPSVPEDDEPNGSYLTANVIGLNDSTTGHVGYYYNLQRDTVDWYTITTTQDGPFYIYLESLNSEFTWAYLYDSDGSTLLASGYSTSAFSINRQDLAAGTYYVRVNTFYSYDYSPYKIRNESISVGLDNDAEPNDDVASAVVISPNSTNEGHIGYYNSGVRDVYDWYETTIPADGNLTLSLTGSVAGKYTWIYLYDSDGSTILQSSYSLSTFSISRDDLAQGTYYVRINEFYTGSEYTGYTLTSTFTTIGESNDLEPNNTTETATPLQTNTTVEGHIGYYNSGARDEYDFYALTIASAGDLTFSVDAIRDVYIYCRLYEDDGTTLLGGSYSYGSYTFTETDLPAGNYIVKVNCFYLGSEYTPYTLTNTYCPDAITIIAEGETTFCDGESVLLYTEDHHLSYLWSDGSTTETNAVTLSGDYSLTIDNGSGCVRTSNTINAESTPLPVAIIDADGPTAFCDGGSVTLSVPAGPDSYLWSTGETTPTITVSSTGDYSVQLFKNTCTAISDPIAITVNTNPTPTISADGSTTFCDGGDVTLTSS